jgi:hypothetical protein
MANFSVSAPGQRSPARSGVPLNFHDYAVVTTVEGSPYRCMSFLFPLRQIRLSKLNPLAQPRKETHMFKRMVKGQTMVAVILGSVALLSQQLPQSSSSPVRMEFPIVMTQNIVAGKTPVGTKVQAKLVAATLVNGIVVPRDAVLSGEVTESVKKSASDPSRLSIRMDSADWKKGSVPIKVYLTGWYYPEAAAATQDLSYQPPDAANSKKNWNGMGAYPDPNNHISQQKFPAGDDSNKDAGSVPAASPASNISAHRAVMKNVQSMRNSDGAVVLINQRSDLKLDRVTTYVLASSDLIPAK